MTNSRLSKGDCLQAKAATKEAVNAREMGYLKAAKSKLLDKVSEVRSLNDTLQVCGKM